MATRKLNAHPLNSLLRSALTRTAAGALGATAPLMALANPSGGQVVGGSATINAPSGNGLVINQNSQRAVIDWQQFSVGSNEYVQFVQPNSSSVVLNKVIGGSPSSIFGDIKANGQVFLVNPNGVYFAPGSSIDVQGLVASTLDMDSAAFMRGKNVFSRAQGSSAATVVNQGNIVTARGGYVVLAGDYVENDGSINAQAGRVVLAAGNSATLTLDRSQLVSYVVDSATLAHLAGVENTGSITANGGGVIMTADVANALTATAVNNSGLVMAQSARNEKGTIVLLAKGGDIENSGTLDASAAANAAGVAGGSVIIRGDKITRLDPTSVISTVGNQAHGGFIELSGHQLAVRGNVTAGRQGNLLIDPATINIVSGTNHNSVSAGIGTIGTGFIESKLNAGSNVAILASNAIQHVSGTDITATGTGNLTLAIGTVGGGSCGIGGICVGHGSPSINRFAGSINLSGLPISIHGDLVIDAGGNSGGQISMVAASAKSITLHAGQIGVAGALSASGGGISISGRTGAGQAGITITGAVTATGAFKASFSNEGGANVGTVTLHKVTAKSINVNAGIIHALGTLHATGTGTNDGVKLFAFGNGSSSAEAAPNGPQISTKKVIADHGGIDIETQNGSGSSVITVNGNLQASHGIVELFTSGNPHFGGNITVTGNITGSNVRVDANGIGSAGGKVNITGNIIATDANNATDVSISAADGAGNGVVTINGTITAARGVTINASGGAAAITVGAITANTHGCSGECGTANVDLEASNGTVTATGDIVLVKDPARQGQVFMRGKSLQFGNITALGGSISLDANTTAAGGANIVQTSGKTLKAGQINVDLNASYGGHINLFNLTASSAAHPAGIEITARSNQGSDLINVGGNITVNGKGGHGLSSGMPGIGIGMPVAAYLVIGASGSAEAASKVNVTGTINVVGHAGVINFNQSLCGAGSGCESGRQPGIHGQITGGLAEVRINANGSNGSVHLGATTVKGPDALVEVDAATVKTGALTVTGSGHVTDFHYSGSGNPTVTTEMVNNIGAASVSINGTDITTGNITVSGKGSAELNLQGQNIVAGNIAVSATAAHGSRSGSILGGSSGFFRGLMGFQLGSGSFTAGRADVFIGSGSSHHVTGLSPMGVLSPGPGPVAQSIKVGTVSVTGVGEAELELAASNIQAKSLTAIATKGTMVGTGVSGSGNEVGPLIHTTFNINGGEAHIGLDGGLSSTSVITVAGNLSATGPAAGVDMDAHTVKVSGGITAIGSGGAVNVKSVITRSSAGTVHFIGPGDVTGVNIGGATSTGSVNVGGTIKVKGPGLVGIFVAGNNVTLGGVSASASNTAKYSILDTRVSNTTDNFTAGSVAVLVIEGNSSGITGPATITGDVTLNAPHGNAFLPGQLTVGGTVTITAAGGIGTDPSTIAPRFNEIGSGLGKNSSSSNGIPSSGIGPLTLKAAGISLVAGSNLDLTSATLAATGNIQVLADGNLSLTGTTLNAGGLSAIAGGSLDLSGATVKVTGATQLVAGFNGTGKQLLAKDIILSGVNITTGVFEASAGGTIHNGGGPGTLKANALSVLAGKDIDLSSTDITVGAGTVPGVTGDQTVIVGLQTAGIAPLSLAPNATFIAGGDLKLGDLSMTGTYLYLQAASVAILGKVTVPTGTVVQVAPIDPTASMGMEKTGSNGSGFNIANDDFLSLFPEITLVLGSSAETGAANLGTNGAFDIGDDNLVIATTGTVTGLDKVTSTGLVTSLLSILGPPVPPPTSSEIDPNSGNNTGNKKHGEAVGGEVTGTGTGTLIEHDNQPPSGTCH